jgi:hypothetical protein
MNLHILVIVMASSIVIDCIFDIIHGGQTDRRIRGVARLIVTPLNVAIAYFIINGVLA